MSKIKVNYPSLHLGSALHEIKRIDRSKLNPDQINTLNGIIEDITELQESIRWVKK